jgi:hypothetical protein
MDPANSKQAANAPRSAAYVRWPELLALVVAIESIAAALLDARFHLAGGIPWIDYYVIWLIPIGAVVTGTLCFWLWRMWRADDDRPLRTIVAKFRSINRRVYLETVVPILVLPPFLASHTTFKVMLDHLAPYNADAGLARLDGFIGLQPWQLTHALIGPLGTLVLDRIYFSWVIVVYVMLLAVLFLPGLSRQRPQVLLTFVATWIILGTLIALLVPSVGPCYYGKVSSLSPYTPLMDRLATISESHHLMALGVQSRLWVEHTRDAVGFGSGVSAMPSMHVAIATITALLLRRLGYGWLGWLWLASIWIGSIHLGWHYASDGIVAALVTALIWKVVDRLLSRSGIADLPPIAHEPAVSSESRLSKLQR